MAKVFINHLAGDKQVPVKGTYDPADKKLTVTVGNPGNQFRVLWGEGAKLPYVMEVDGGKFIKITDESKLSHRKQSAHDFLVRHGLWPVATLLQTIGATAGKPAVIIDQVVERDILVAKIAKAEKELAAMKKRLASMPQPTTSAPAPADQLDDVAITNRARALQRIELAAQAHDDDDWFHVIVDRETGESRQVTAEEANEWLGYEPPVETAAPAPTTSAAPAAKNTDLHEALLSAFE